MIISVGCTNLYWRPKSFGKDHTHLSDASSALKSITPKKREQLHVSGVNMLSDCGIRFYYRYILGIRRPPAAYILVGDAVDAVVSKNLQNKIDKGELLPTKEVIGIAEEAFDNSYKKNQIELDPDDKREGRTIEQVVGEAKDKSTALAELHSNDVAPKIQPKRIKRSFTIDMDKWLRIRARSLHDRGAAEKDKVLSKILHAEAKSLNAASRTGLDCAGEIDIVEEYFEVAAPASPLFPPVEKLVRVIRDTKTSAKSPTKSLLDGSKDPGIADDSDQLTTYALATHVFDGSLPDLMVLDYLVYTKAKNRSYVPTKTTRTMEDVNVFLNRFANAAHAYRSGVFVPAKADWWGCSQKYCGYFDMCQYAKKPKLTQISKAVGQ